MTNSHVKFRQPGPSSLSTLDLNANVNIGRQRHRRTGDDISSLPVLHTGELKRGNQLIRGKLSSLEKR